MNVGWCRDKSTGGLVYVHYTGVVAITPELGTVLSGHPEAKSTDFGDSCKAPFLSFPLAGLFASPSAFRSSKRG